MKQDSPHLAMLFAEALGPEEYRRSVKTQATDIDGAARAEGRVASCSPFTPMGDGSDGSIVLMLELP